jgi:Flp pilus assembly protein protease CpaA
MTDVKRYLIPLILTVIFTFIIYATVMQVPLDTNNTQVLSWAIIVPLVFVGIYILVRVFIPLVPR